MELNSRLKLTTRAGFTLIELLAVIGIIALLLTIGAVGIRNLGEAQGPSSGAAVAEALMDEARAVAMSRGTTARFVINADETVVNEDNQAKRGRYLREMVVLYKAVDPDTGEVTEEWTQDSQSTLLPTKVFYSPEVSEDSSPGKRPEKERHVLIKGGSAVDCYVYEFNSEGICTTPGASFVVVGGVLPKGESEPILGGKNNMAGFVVWRNGRTSAFRGPDHIDN